MIRLTAYVSGRVQRVGYRAKVVSLANEIDTTWFDHKFQRASACGRDKKTCKRLGRWLIKKLRLLTTEAQSSLRLRIPFHPTQESPPNCFRDSRLRSFVLRALCDSVVYSRKPPGLVSQLRLLTTEAQSSLRRSEFLSIQPKKAHPIASGIVVSVRSSSVRSADSVVLFP